MLGAPNRVNIPCLMHDTRLCQIDVKMTNCNTRRAKISTILRNGHLALYINTPTAKWSFLIEGGGTHFIDVKMKNLVNIFKNIYNLKFIQFSKCFKYSRDCKQYTVEPLFRGKPSGKATWQCKSKHKCIDFYPWREATPLEMPYQL